MLAKPAWVEREAFRAAGSFGSAFGSRYRDGVKELVLNRSTVDAIDREATRTWPEECCGLVLAAGDQQWVRPVPNVQNDLHRSDPEEHPRDARTAYAMDSRARLAVEREADDEKRPIGVFYHSHPEHAAYFSETDRAMAMFFDEPAYPDAAQLVVSVYGGRVAERKAFAWDEERRDFVEVPLRIR